MEPSERSLGFIAVMLVLGGCAASDCDPSRGGFIRGIGCSVSGYGARQDNLRNTRDSAEVERGRSKEALDETELDKKAAEDQVAAAQSEYEALDRDLAAMQTKLSRAKAGNEDLKRKLRGLQQEMKLLKADTVTPPDEKARQLGKLRERKAHLERQIEGVL